MAREILSVRADADAATELWGRSQAELPIASTEGFLVAELTTDDGPIDRAWGLLAEFKEVALEQPRIVVEHLPGDTGHDGTPGRITLHCEDAPAFFLTIEPTDPRVQPEDNGFLMLPGETRTITIRRIHGLAGRAPAVTAEDSSRVRIRTIRSTYR